MSDYLSYVENRITREEHMGITAMLADAEKRGDEGALRELLERRGNVLTALKNKSAK